MPGLFDYNLFIPRVTGKQLEQLAEEVSFYTGKEWDSHDLAGAILAEFIKLHRSQAYKDIAKMITGQRKMDVEDEAPTIRFFRAE